MTKRRYGNELRNLKAIKKGTSVTFTLEANESFIPSKLVIDGTEYTDFSAAGTIEKTVEINKSISVSGECIARPATFKITVEPLEHGKIECQDEEDSVFTNLDSCPDGTELRFILTSTDKDYMPKKLTVGTTENTEVLSGAIIETVRVSSSLTVRGEVVPKTVKITINNAINGTISCKNDQGQAFTDFDSVSYGEHLTFILTANAGFTPKHLTIDGIAYEALTQEGTIEKTVEVTRAFEVSGECVTKESSFKIEASATPESKGEITCKDKDGSNFTELNRVREGTTVSFRLVPNNGFDAKKLIINGKDYTNKTSDGFVIVTLDVNTSLTVKGVVEKAQIPHYKIVVKKIENGSITCKDKATGSVFTSVFTSFNDVESGFLPIFLQQISNWLKLK